MSTDVKTMPQEQQVAANGVKLPIYMDTTPPRPWILGSWRMLPYFMEKFGTQPAAITHLAGRQEA